MGAAPLVLLPCVDLGQALTRDGSWGYRQAATSVGVALGAFWLELARLGLDGSPCGGFVGGELGAWGVDGLTTAAMLSFAVGHRVGRAVPAPSRTQQTGVLHAARRPHATQPVAVHEVVPGLLQSVGRAASPAIAHDAQPIAT